MGRSSSSRPQTSSRRSVSAARTARCSSASRPRPAADGPRARAREARRQAGRPHRLQRRIPRRRGLRRERERGRDRLRAGRAPRGEGAEGRDRRRHPGRGRAARSDAGGADHLDRRSRPTSSAASPRTSAKVIHAPAETLRLCVLCLVSEGHLIIEDFPGVGKTMLAKAMARSLDCSFSRLQFTPDLLPVGRHGRQRLQPALERVRVPAGPDLREPSPRRRDQPRPTEDPGRAPRVHAGEPGHDRRRQLRARPAVHGHGDPEPDRVRGHVPAARGAARPLHDAARHRLPAARPGGADAVRADERPAARDARAGDERDRDHRRDRRGDARLRRDEPAPLRRRPRRARRGATSGSTSARARAPGSRSCASPRRGRSPTAASTCCPTTCRRSRRPFSRTG